jgi:hypothetical protein
LIAQLPDVFTVGNGLTLYLPEPAKKRAKRRLNEGAVGAVFRRARSSAGLPARNRSVVVF